MYSTCLFCSAGLGTNEAIEHFPVGRRLAFDAAKGRLWVVCRKCERWNLTPLEERWEAIEEAERLFSETRLRVSTDNIGLAKLREGTTLIRIGTAMRPELAAWRYGDQFGRRRRKHVALTAAGISVVAGIAIAGPATGFIAGGGWGLWQGANALYNLYQTKRVRVKLRLPDSDDVVPIRKNQLEHTSIVRTEDDSWGLRISMRKPGGRQAMELRPESTLLMYTGPAALRAASKLLPAVNESGAKQAEVQSAVQIVTDAGNPDRVFQRYASHPDERVRLRDARGEVYKAHHVHLLPKEVRLALEMAAHEEQERRALEGELAILEAAWREAEEVAKIADEMFLPENTESRLGQLRGGRASED
jgi:hypothetical protein